MTNDEQDLEATEIPQTETQPATEPASQEPPPAPEPEPISPDPDVLGVDLHAAIMQQFHEAAAQLNASIAPPAPPSAKLMYEGPGDRFYLPIEYGQIFAVTEEMEPLLARLRAEGHLFSPVE